MDYILRFWIHFKAQIIHYVAEAITKSAKSLSTATHRVLKKFERLIWRASHLFRGRISRSFHRLLTWFASRRRPIIFFAVSFTFLLGVMAVWIPFFYSLEEMEKIGSYVTGFGQLIILIWIIATFYLQMKDLHEQRLELTRQARALENTSLYNAQQIGIELFKYYKGQLDRISRSLVDSLCDRETLDQLSESHNQGNIDVFSQFLIDNANAQSLLLEAVNRGDPAVCACVNRYVELYQELSRILTSTDNSGILRRAIMSQTPVSDLYSVLRVPYHDIRPTTDN